MNNDRAQAFAWHQAGNLAGAESLYRRLLAASPSDPEIVYRLAVLLVETGRDAVALDKLRELVRLQPTNLAGWHLYAMVCRRLGRYEEGLRAATEALQLDGEDSAGLCLFGMLQVNCGDYRLGEGALRRALELQPGLAEAWHSLGMALQAQDYFADAMQAYRRALVPGQANALIHYNIGLCAEGLGDFPTALAEYSTTLRTTDRLDARTRVAYVQAMICDFAGEASSIARMEELLARPEQLLPGDMASPFAMLYLPLSTGARQQILRSTVARVEREAAGLSPPRLQPVEDGDRPLRIGYLSPDFGDHPVGTLIQDLFAAHDRRLVRAYGYSLTLRTGPVADSIRAGCDVFRDARDLSTQSLAETIAADGIDILVDLGGFTRGTRPAVLALRPARLQMSYLGYIHGSNAPWLDYTVFDSQVAPPGADAGISEAIIRLPGTMLPAPAVMETGLPDRSRFGLPTDAPLFASFNNAYKLDSDLLTAWAEIAKRLPDAHFVVYLSQAARPRFLEFWRRLGGRAEAVIFVDRIPQADHAARAASCDLFLDAFRYQGGMTGMAAIAAGLPILCLEGGSTPAARMGVSLNRFLGLDELVCPDIPTYVERAVAWGREGTDALKRRLAGAVAERGLFDPARTARALEQAYRAAWNRQRQGLAPADIDLS